MLSESAIELAERVLLKSQRIRTAARRKGLEFLDGHIVDSIWPNQILVRDVILAGMEEGIVSRDEFHEAVGHPRL